MNRRESFAVFAAAALTLFSSAASAQVSEDRLQELIREAQKATQPSLAFTSKAPEGPTMPITVDDAVKFALERNLDLAVARLTPELQDIAVVAAAKLLAAREGREVVLIDADLTGTSLVDGLRLRAPSVAAASLAQCFS